ncbi:hypothetical protein FKM82_018880 [Ascaphus truei]
MFSASKILFSLCTFAICISSSVGSDGSSVTNLESQEKYDDFLESREGVQNQRNLNSEELRQWRSYGIDEMRPPIMNKCNNLPIPFERHFLEERGVKPAANLPLRFGRASEDKIAKSVPNLPQRFGRYVSAKANFQSLANLPQRFGRSSYGGRFIQSLATLPLRFGRATHLQKLQYEINSHPLEIQQPEEDNDRIQSMDYDNEGKLQNQ